MRRWWLISLLALALSVTACGKDDKDSKEAVVAGKPSPKRKRRKKRKKHAKRDKKTRRSKKAAAAGDKGSAVAKEGAADRPAKGAGADAAPAPAAAAKRPEGAKAGATAGKANDERALAAKPADAPAAAPPRAGAAAPAKAAAVAAAAIGAAAGAAAAAADAPAKAVVVPAKEPDAAADEAKRAEAAKAAAAAAEAAARAAEQQQAEAAARRKPPEAALDITGYLSTADLSKVLTKWRLQRSELAGIKPTKGYNTVYFAPKKGGGFGVSLQVWRDLNLIDSRTRFNTMKNTYTDVVSTNKVTEQGFRAYYGGVVSLVFVDPRRPLLASVSCATKICDADKLIELSRRVANRLR